MVIRVDKGWLYSFNVYIICSRGLCKLNAGPILYTGGSANNKHCRDSCTFICYCLIEMLSLTPVLNGDIWVTLQNSERRWVPGITEERIVCCIRYLTVVFCCEIEPTRIEMFVFGWVSHGRQTGTNACAWNDVDTSGLC